MKPRVQAHVVELPSRPIRIGPEGWDMNPGGEFQFGWHVFWATEAGRIIRTHFWTWAAALDFANERALEARHVNHVHLWPTEQGG